MNSGTFGSSLYRAPGNYCDDQRDAACPTGCDAELRDMNLFDHQRMQSDQDLKGLKNLRFECLPDGQCPNMAETKKAFKDLGEYLCGKKDGDAEFSCVGEACAFVGCK